AKRLQHNAGGGLEPFTITREKPNRKRDDGGVNMIAEILEAHLEMISELIENKQPIPPALIRNVKLAIAQVEEVIPKDKLNDFLNALDKLPTQ
ncbi:unnamed protein product, partial [marine sediment metagenome]